MPDPESPDGSWLPEEQDLCYFQIHPSQPEAGSMSAHAHRYRPSVYHGSYQLHQSRQ